MSVPTVTRPLPGSVRRQRLVLLALFAPFVGIGVVLWLLLPGGTAATSYATSEFRHEATLRPDYWTNHTATVRGYLARVRCPHGICEPMVLTAQPQPGNTVTSGAWPPDAVLVAPQAEAGWHRTLRHALPSLLASPLTATTSPGRWISVTGSLRAGYDGIGPPVLVPISL